MANGGRAVTSQDVAAQAGVSRAAVSAVLNDAHSNIRVAEPTRSRILAAARDLGYRPHPDARALRRQRSNFIGYVHRASRGRLWEEAIPYGISEHIYRASLRHGYHTFDVAPATSPHVEDGTAQALFGRRVEGVIFDNPSTAEEVVDIVAQGVPVVQLLRPQDVPGAANVTVDPSRGIQEAVEHLVASGHSRIAFIGNGGPHPVDRARLGAFRRALVACGLDCPDELVRLYSDYAIEDARRAVHALLRVVERPTAILAASDSFALGALRGLHEARLWVPDDMSLIGYDDALASSLYPPLTSVRQPLDEVAERAVALIVARADRDTGHPWPVDSVFDTRLVVRGSTAPPP